MIRNKTSFYGEELSHISPNSQAVGPPFVGCPRLLIQYIRSYPPYWRPFLHPQPEDSSQQPVNVCIMNKINPFHKALQIFL
jgi:hypothetical protein